MPSTVALTGASGFIGRTLAHQVTEAGWQVRALVRSPSKVSRTLPASTEIIQGDLNNRDSLLHLVENCESVIHVAGATRGISRGDFQTINVQGTANLIQACKAQGHLPKFVLLSSLAAREPSLSPYAWSKREGEKLLLKEGENLQWLILRPPAVYGPHDKNLLPLFHMLQKGVGLQLNHDTARFSLIHVDDVARAVIHWLKKGSPLSSTFEIDDGHPKGYSWPEVFRLVNPNLRLRIRVPSFFLSSTACINEKLGSLLRYTPLFTRGKVAELQHDDWVCDSQSAREQLGWTPDVSLQEGLRRLLT